MGTETKNSHDSPPLSETKIEIESKLTLGPTIKTPDQITQDLYELYCPPEVGVALPQIGPEFTLRQYWWTGNLDDKHTIVEILDRDNPVEVKVRGKTSNGKGTKTLNRNEHKESFTIDSHLPTRNLERVEQVFNNISVLSKKLREGYYKLGHIMLKERRGFKMEVNGIPLKVTFDRMLEAADKRIREDFLDQIEVEYNGKEKEIDEKTLMYIQQQIEFVTAEIKAQLEQRGYTFQAESPTKDKWMIQHYGNINGHTKV